jgi:eukaryotic-like serine/threonine-protein kinase
MTLAPGSKLGPYEILAPIGAGGMGEVYKARDTRLDRTIAIKVLSQKLSSSSDAKLRFEREAKTIAAFNHPHICTLHDIGSNEGADFLVMEFLEGQTLAQRLEKGALHLDEALRYAIEIADALEKAHGQRIFHRDLKPANIMITKSGAKLLDFGLAKLKGGNEPVERGNLSESSTKTYGLTAEGTIFGTLQYMAPEQLEGQEADARADIFSFGATLYEMLSGKKAFEGASQAGLIAAVLKAEPIPLLSLQPTTPPVLAHLIHGCMAKNRSDRWQTAHDVAKQLEWISASRTDAAPIAGSKAGSCKKIWIVLAALPVLAIVVALMYIFRAAPQNLPMRFTVTLPGNVTFSAGEYPLRSAVISPDGRHLVFAGVDQSIGRARLYVRPIDSIEAVPLQGTEEGFDPFWSPDNRSIGFFAHGKLKRVDLRGGSPQIICDAQSGGGGAWSKDDVILASLSNPGPLSRVPAGGGSPMPVTSFDPSSETDHDWPQFTADGKHFLYMAWGRTASENAVYVGLLDSQGRKLLLRGVSSFIYAHPDNLIFLRDSTLFAQRFEGDRFELLGQPVALAEDALAPVSASQNGAVTYRTVKAGPDHFLWIKQDGTEIGAAVPPGYYVDPDLSPDGSKLAFASRESPGAGLDIWILEFASGVLRRFTLDAANNRAPHWSLDGSTIVFLSSRSSALGLYRKNAYGVGAEDLILLSNVSLWPYQMSPDGHHLLYFAGVSGAMDIMMMSLDDFKSTPLIQTRFNECDGALSPDGRWLAYVSNESGRYEIYLTTFPPSSTKLAVTSNGGCDPIWSKDGGQLFYVNSSTDELWSVPVKSGNPPQFGVYRRIHPGPLDYVTAHSFALDPKGERILIAQSWARRGDITVLLNWQSLLKK